MKRFSEVWEDIKNVLSRKSEVETICKKSVNKVKLGSNESVEVVSENPLLGEPKIRTLKQEDFRYAWGVLIKEGCISKLKDINKVIGRRAIILAILCLLDYVDCSCYKGKVRVCVKI